MQRRQVLQTTVAALGAGIGLAGCLSSSDDRASTRVTEGASRESDAVETTPTDRDDPEADVSTEEPTDPEVPPRESEVFAAVEVSENRLRVAFESAPVVQSRMSAAETATEGGSDARNATATATNSTSRSTPSATGNATSVATTDESSFERLAGSLAALSPVGVAAGRSPGKGGRSGGSRSGRSGSGGSGWGGRKGGSGISGSSKSGKSGSASGGGRSRRPAAGERGSGASSARGRNGRYKWRGGRYAAWFDSHGHEVRDYDAAVVECGVGYLGGPDATEAGLPGPGPVEWTRRCDGDHDEMAFEPSESGWYRVGARLRAADGDRDFGWEAVDVRLLDGDDGWLVDSQWKVSPRL